MAAKITRILSAINIARIILVTDVNQFVYSATDKTAPTAPTDVNSYWCCF